MNRLHPRKAFLLGGAAIAASVLLLGCAVAEPRPAGISRRIVFSVVPVYPKSFEITAGGPRSLTAEEIKDAWRQKALLVANGKRFKTSPLVVHDTESIAYGTYWPARFRTVNGTITLTD